MFTQVVAAIALLTCLALAVHMALPARLRRRVDAGLARLGAAALARLELARRWRQRRLRERAANDAAAELIRRARQSSREPGDRAPPAGEWDGNVYRPKSFDRPKKPH